eukprot:COSAG06_NODE_5380_length_3513_cov_14.915934_2_plen_69_part_00
MPPTVTYFDKLIPQVICQKFRNNVPVSTEMLRAAFDPEIRKDFMWIVVASTIGSCTATNFEECDRDRM